MPPSLPSVDEKVRVVCPTCGRHVELPFHLDSWTCADCETSSYFRRCPACEAPYQYVIDEALRNPSFSCPWCRQKSKLWKLAPSNAGSFAGHLEELGLTPPVNDKVFRFLPGCVIVGGQGHALRVGWVCSVAFGSENVVIVGGGKRVTIPYTDIETIDVGGRGIVTSGGGFIGGGFGLEDAMQGMLASSVLNSLTTTTEVETLIYIGAEEQHFVLFWDGLTPDQLRISLAPTFGRVRFAKRASHLGEGPLSTNSNLVDQLKELASLKASGVLTDDEFIRAKRRLLK